jgi:DNA polymerase family A/3'-5' exonuclease
MVAYTSLNDSNIDSYIDFLRSEKPEYLAYDTETMLKPEAVVKTKKGLISKKQPMHNPWNANVRLHQFYEPSRGVHVIDTLETSKTKIIELLKVLFLEIDCSVFAHYAIFDGSFLYAEYGVFPKNLFCTQIASQVFWAGLFQGLKISEKKKTAEKQPSPFSLAAVYARLHPGSEPVDKTLQSSDWGVQQLSQAQIEYACNDVIYGYAVGKELLRLCTHDGLICTLEDEQAGLTAFIHARCKGFPIALDQLDQVFEQYSTAANKIRTRLEKYVLTHFGWEFNPNSSQQVKKLFADLGLELESTGAKYLSGLIDDSEDAETPAIDTEKLTPNQRKIMESLILYRSLITASRYLTSMKDSYDYKLGVVHGDFNPMASQGTGRSSCRKPTLQIIPRLKSSWEKLGLPAIRTIFTASEDWRIISLDSAGCHVQIARSYSRDNTLRKIVNHGLDPYVTLGVQLLKIGQVEKYQEYLTLADTKDDIGVHNAIKKILKDKNHPDNFAIKEARQLWKKVFLSRLNGAGARKIHGELIANDPPIRSFSVDDCKLACKAFDQLFDGLAQFQKDIVKRANSSMIQNPFGAYQGYNLGDRFLYTNKYAIIRSLDGGRFFIPLMFSEFNNSLGAKPTEVLAFLWQRVEGSCVKRASYETVQYIEENSLTDRAWLANINHDEMVLIVHESIAYDIAKIGNQNIENAFRRYVGDYTDRAKIEDKIGITWADKD